MQIIWMSGMLLCAAYQDIRERKISNGLIRTGLIGICIFRYVSEGTSGILWMLISGFAAIGIFFPLFFIHALGAGDIKLFSLVAAMDGLNRAFQVCTLWFFLAGAVSLGRLLSQHRLYQRLAYAFHYLTSVRETHMPYYDKERDGEKDTIPLAPFLAAAYGIIEMGRWQGIW